MFNLSKREKKLISLCLYIFVFILYYNIYLSDTLEHAYSIYGNVKNYNSKLQNISRTEKNSKELNKNNKGDTFAFKLAYENNSNSDIAFALKSIADSSKIYIEELLFNDINKDKTINNKLRLSIIPVKVCVTGNYNSLTEFIEKINNQQFCNINNVIIKRRNDNMELNMDINYYYLGCKEGDKSIARK